MIEINFYNEYSAEYNKYLDLYTKLGSIALDLLSKHADYEISVTFVDNQKIHEINKNYRNKDYATDVISFETGMDEVLEDTIDLGDIFISVDKAVEQAKEYKHSLDRELMFLFVHGLLHCLGYDHLNEQDEKVMFDLQEEILNEWKEKI